MRSITVSKKFRSPRRHPEHEVIIRVITQTVSSPEWLGYEFTTGDINQLSIELFNEFQKEGIKLNNENSHDDCNIAGGRSRIGSI